MKPTIFILASVAFCLTQLLGCGASDTDSNKSKDSQTQNDSNSTGTSETPARNVIAITPGPDAQKKAQEALILAQPGDVIEFGEGTFEFDGTLSIDGIQNVVVRGKGMKKTILNFAGIKSGKGAQGMKVKADRFVLEDLTLEDTPGDAIKLQECNGMIIRRVRTWWSGGPSTDNGAYGLYPVLSNNVLIDGCVAEGASDAGIYVGQSKDVIVRNCVAEKNVAGIEIENCIRADVYNNVTKNNTGGILVFSLPGLTIKNGTDCRIFQNKITENNHENFAKQGAMVATVPPGTGLMIMANDRVEAFDNVFNGNQGASCLIASFMITQRKFEDPEYDPYPEAINIRDNEFSNGGANPQGEHFGRFVEATGQRLPDIVFDGLVNAEKFDGNTPTGDQRFSITGNGQATFVNLDLGTLMSGKMPMVSMDLSVYSAKLPALKPVEIADMDTGKGE